MNRFKVWLWHKLFTIPAAIRMYQHLRAAYATVLRDMKPDVIILPEDVVGQVGPLVIDAGHDQNIPTVVLPYTMCNETEAYRSLEMVTDLQMGYGMNRLVAWLFPAWVMEENGKRILRLPAGHILGHWFAGCRVPDPWMINSGHADVIAVESEAARNYYRASSIPASRMQVVGSICDDEIASTRVNKASERAALNGALGLRAGRPLLVVGGCPDQSTCCPHFAYGSLDEFADCLADVLKAAARKDYEVVFRPHPNLMAFAEVMQERGITTTTLPTSKLVGMCDAYVGFASSTIRWAIISGVPVVNYDVFGYGYSEFLGVPSVETATDHRSFAEAVRRLPDRVGTDDPYWGDLDAKATDRIHSLIQSISTRKTVLYGATP